MLTLAPYFVPSFKFPPSASPSEGGGRRSDRKEFRPLPASLPEGGGRRSDRKESPQAANAFTCNTSHP